MPLTAGTRTDRALAPPDMATLAPFIRPFPAGAQKGCSCAAAPGWIPQDRIGTDRTDPATAQARRRRVTGSSGRDCRAPT